jgi:hypothetical protein
MVHLLPFFKFASHENRKAWENKGVGNEKFAFTFFLMFVHDVFRYGKFLASYSRDTQKIFIFFYFFISNQKLHFYKLICWLKSCDAL